ncbi:MAG: 2-amino-4-hydroxy-6-hydroxymethyldihydropteridine diphosphokinase [Spirochaetales bacterium]|nr:2-amino-4-hydroxy-6-hydroxymethyldihydropteridine diphosphokinase [Spirochaetales bacterium]
MAWPHLVYLGTGSNLHPDLNVPQALRALYKKGIPAGGTRIRVSTHYETPSLGRPGDPLFVNGVWQLYTTEDPDPLKQHLRDIEHEIGRRRGTDSHAPREIDLDILLFDELIDKERKIPDPDIYERPFIYIPLLELAPDLVVPGDTQALSRLVDTSSHTMTQSPLTGILHTIAGDAAYGGTDRHEH